MRAAKIAATSVWVSLLGLFGGASGEPVRRCGDALAYGAEASMRMYLADADLAPERELNEILWRSIKGPTAVMPPAVRAAFVRRAGTDADDDDDRR